MTLTPGTMWRGVLAARVPSQDLVALAPLRDRSSIRIHRQADWSWVRWREEDAEVIRLLHPIPRVEFFALRSDRWFRFGSRLPAAEPPPPGDGLPVAAILIPDRVAALRPSETHLSPVALTLARCDAPKPASALECSIADLQAWANRATMRAVSGVSGAVSNGRALLLGARLPAVPRAVRFWGGETFIPLGFRAEPDLPSSALREVVGAAADEFLFLTEEAVTLVSRSVFEPLTRAGIRLAARAVVE